MIGSDPVASTRPSRKCRSNVASMVFGAEESLGALKLSVHANFDVSHSQPSRLACLPADILQYMLTFLRSDIGRLDRSWTCRVEREIFWFPVLRNSFGSEVTVVNVGAALKYVVSPDFVFAIHDGKWLTSRGIFYTTDTDIMSEYAETQLNSTRAFRRILCIKDPPIQQII